MVRRASTHRSQARFLARVAEGARPAPFPGFVAPCQPVLRKVPPPGEGWFHEIKHDGYRAQAQFDKRARILMRRGADWAERMPGIAAALAGLPANNVVLDGEVVAVGETGLPVFGDLAAGLRKRRPSGRVVYYAFDLLYLDGFDLRGVALAERKRVLRAFLKDSRQRRILYCDHLTGDGAEILEKACALGLEGIVSKRADAPYRSGKRPEWIKTKCAAWRAVNRGRWREFSVEL